MVFTEYVIYTYQGIIHEVRKKRMPLKIVKMNERFAIEALCWKYDYPYDFYNHVLTTNAIHELLSNHYHIVLGDQDEQIGFFCTGTSAQVPEGHDFGAYPNGFVDVGIGMKPEMTGKGNGYRFFSFILSFVEETCKDKDVRLTVATFNKRAIHLYEKMGFRKQMEFANPQTEFITMVKKNRYGVRG